MRLRCLHHPVEQGCLPSASKAPLLGSIAGLGNEYVTGIDAIHCQTGAVFAQVQAFHKEDVLNALGNAGTHLRGKLGESLATIQKFDAPGAGNHALFRGAEGL
jgi:eukaryotic-like serine/threonine-protein kinase